MDPNLDNYVLEGDGSMYANEAGLVVPFVTRAGQEPDLTGQSEGATRVSGVSIQHTPATKLWFGQVRNLAGYRSVPHHHGEAETGGFVLSGRARIYFGERFEDYLDMSEGDWVFVPPFMPHVECKPRPQPPAHLDDGPHAGEHRRQPAQVDDADLRDWADRP